MLNQVTVYVGDYGDYVIPQQIVSRAYELNRGKRLNDRRTKGSRLISSWGKSQDATEFTKIALKKHYSL